MACLVALSHVGVACCRVSCACARVRGGRRVCVAARDPRKKLEGGLPVDITNYMPATAASSASSSPPSAACSARAVRARSDRSSSALPMTGASASWKQAATHQSRTPAHHSAAGAPPSPPLGGKSARAVRVSARSRHAQGSVRRTSTCSAASSSTRASGSVLRRAATAGGGAAAAVAAAAAGAAGAAERRTRAPRTKGRSHAPPSPRKGGPRQSPLGT